MQKKFAEYDAKGTKRTKSYKFRKAGGKMRQTSKRRGGGRTNGGRLWKWWRRNMSKLLTGDELKSYRYINVGDTPVKVGLCPADQVQRLTVEERSLLATKTKWKTAKCCTIKGAAPPPILPLRITECLEETIKLDPTDPTKNEKIVMNNNQQYLLAASWNVVTIPMGLIGKGILKKTGNFIFGECNSLSQIKLQRSGESHPRPDCAKIWFDVPPYIKLEVDDGKTMDVHTDVLILAKILEGAKSKFFDNALNHGISYQGGGQTIYEHVSANRVLLSSATPSDKRRVQWRIKGPATIYIHNVHHNRGMLTIQNDRSKK
jgi:hypothetical protein